MMVLVVGGSGSGKSAYAEERAQMLAAGGAVDGYSGGRSRKYYLATMRIFDEEGQRKADRHRRLRSGKGFCTVELPRAVHQLLGRPGMKEAVILLECISNLTANEMFAGPEPEEESRVAGTVTEEVAALKDGAAHLVVVSSQVSDDGVAYDGATMAYIRALGKINRNLARMADQVVEVVAGIPLTLK